MKRIIVFLVSAASMFAADFTTGQAARLVIGQRTFTSQDPNSSDVIVGGVSGLAYAADTLFVADSNRVGAGPSNHRVLLFQNISGMVPPPTAELEFNSKCPACIGQATLVLGQPDFATTTLNLQANQSNLRLPTSVASDGVHVAVADTDHNRVLIWNSIPSFNNAPADVVLGQPDFASFGVPTSGVPTAQSVRGPQGVWIQNGKLYVADTQNNRVLIWNQIPTANNAPADVVLGQPNFTSFVQVDLTSQNEVASPTNMLNPVAVTSDGQRLYVTDLGFNRVLIWRTIPTTNAAPADIAIGQPDLTKSIANHGFTLDENNVQTPVLCTESIGTDDKGNALYPVACNATLNFPRFALAAGNRLFIADGGNDRVLVFNSVPDQSGASADVVLGQIGGSVNQASDAADSLRTPMSLAWDGVNLFVSDAFNRRITVYSIGENTIPYSGVRNAASFEIFATGSILVSGQITAGNTITVAIAPNTSEEPVEYTYKVQASDTLATVAQGIINLLNDANEGQGDPLLRASPGPFDGVILLTAKQSGEAGNDVTLAVTTSRNATIFGTASGSALSGGADAAKIAPGSLVSILAKPETTFAFGTDQANLGQSRLPNELAGTQVYFNGIRAPLTYVSPTQINAQIPWEVSDTTSINAYIRARRPDGGVSVTTPVAVSIVPANPGIFAYPDSGTPQAGIVLHGSSYATGVVSVDGSATVGDVAKVTIENREYSYTIVEGDTNTSVRDKLVELLNTDPKVTAAPSGIFDRIVLRARIAGPDGNGIPYAGSGSESGNIIVSALGPELCCANVAYSRVTPENPAVPGETIIVYATGVGLPVINDENRDLLVTGAKYPSNGPITEPVVAMNSLAGGITANVLYATLKPDSFGMYEVVLQLSQGLTTDAFTRVDIRQDIFVSNVVTLPVASPLAPGMQ